MSTLEIRDKKILVDENGYLTNQDDWNEEVAMALAAREGIDLLSKDQLDIIRFMREYFLKYNRASCKMNYLPRCMQGARLVC